MTPKIEKAKCFSREQQFPMLSLFCGIASDFSSSLKFYPFLSAIIFDIEM